MQDRIPQYPGRIKLTEVSGQTGVYDLTREDGATQAGTPLNKSTLLADDTAALFGLGVSATVNDTFRAINERTSWHVLCDIKPSTSGLYEISASLSNDLRNYSEFVMLLSGGSAENNDYISVNASLTGTFGSKSILANFSVYVFGTSQGQTGYVSTGIGTIINTGSNCIVAIPSSNTESKGNIFNGSISGIKIATADGAARKTFQTNANIILIAR